MSAGEECFMQAMALKLKAGPASPGALALGADGGGSSSGGDSVVGGQLSAGRGAQPNHGGSVKWAPLSNTRQIGSGGEGEYDSMKPSWCRINNNDIGSRFHTLP